MAWENSGGLGLHVEIVELFAAGHFLLQTAVDGLGFFDALLEGQLAMDGDLGVGQLGAEPGVGSGDLVARPVAFDGAGEGVVVDADAGKDDARRMEVVAVEVLQVLGLDGVVAFEGADERAGVGRVFESRGVELFVEKISDVGVSLFHLVLLHFELSLQVFFGVLGRLDGLAEHLDHFGHLVAEDVERNGDHFSLAVGHRRISLLVIMSADFGRASGGGRASARQKLGHQVCGPWLVVFFVDHSGVDEHREMGNDRIVVFGSHFDAIAQCR